MLLRILLGVLVGFLVGYLLPPGYFFWLLAGAFGGFLLGKYHHYY